MNAAELQQIADDLPKGVARSRLEPYREVILRMRRQGRTYHCIRRLLADTCEIAVAYATLHEFVQRRSRPHKVEPEIGSTSERVEEPVTKPKLSHEERVAQRNAVRAAFVKPASEEKPAYRFEFDESKPITNKHYSGEKNGSSTAKS